MAHGFGAARDWGLAPYAERFAAAGFAAFVFDHRHFGASEGAPRRLIDPDRQLADWAAAIETARSRAATDPDRIALWGTSFSGGHVLETAVRDPDVEAVIAQVPFVDGRATLAHLTREAGLTERGSKLIRAVADRALGAVGLGPIEVPIVTEPGEGGLLDSPGALAGFDAVVPDGVDLENRTPARVVLDIPGYRPGRSAAEIDVPVHVVVAEADRLLPVGPTETMLESLAHPSVHRVEAGHFDVFEPAWVERLVAEQVAFLAEALDVD